MPKPKFEKPKIGQESRLKLSEKDKIKIVKDSIKGYESAKKEGSSDSAEWYKENAIDLMTTEIELLEKNIETVKENPNPEIGSEEDLKDRLEYWKEQKSNLLKQEAPRYEGEHKKVMAGVKLEKKMDEEAWAEFEQNTKLKTAYEYWMKRKNLSKVTREGLEKKEFDILERVKDWVKDIEEKGYASYPKAILENGEFKEATDEDIEQIIKAKLKEHPDLEHKLESEDDVERSELIEAYASSLHDEWRAPRRIEGTDKYEPRWKDPKDDAFIEGWEKKLKPGEEEDNVRITEEGKIEIDIANTPYSGLTEAWKAENKASAEVSLNEVIKQVEGGKWVGEPSFMEEASAVVHEKWLERNKDWAPPEQNKPYEELTEDEKEKDRVFVRGAIDMYSDFSKSELEKEEVKIERWAEVDLNKVLDERGSKELKDYLGYTFNTKDLGDKVEIEVSHTKRSEYDKDPEFTAKGTLPKTEELIKKIERLVYTIGDFGEGYGMPEAEAQKTLNALADNLR